MQNARTAAAARGLDPSAATDANDTTYKAGWALVARAWWLDDLRAGSSQVL